jgi:trehalose 6-phosphate synthase
MPPVTADQQASGRQRWIIAANRGPVEFHVDADGERTHRRGSGGLVTALSRLAAYLDTCEWICAPLTEEDRMVAFESGGGSITVRDNGTSHCMRLLPLEDEAFDQYYSVISNPIIWFVQHCLWDLSNAPNITATERAAFDHGYRAVNSAFADAIVTAVPDGDTPTTVMIQDYHLYLVADMVRQAGTDAFLMHFVHVPWPEPDSWRVLPGWMRDELILGLLGNDLVAFQTERYARNFLLTCQELLGLPVDFDRYEVHVDGRTVTARWYPISIDVDDLGELAASEEVAQYELALENVRREHLILRVDRTDLSKNILRGFLAYDTMLDNHPDLAGRVTFLALLQPSRQDVPEYVEYTENILRLAADINLKHGNVEWQPIDLRMENNLPLAVAAYKLFDVLMVNPVFDGLNLVAKEGTVVNERNGVLVLSEHAGVHDEIGDYALSVHPVDIEQQADALYRGLFMPPDERRRRHDACVEVIKRNGLAHWLKSQLADIRQLAAEIDAGLPGGGETPDS